jgi:hypothetical protein
MSLQQLALQLKAKGRGPDTELVHMTKGELDGLHGLARAMYGKDLPINPHTGLHEAGWLKSLLPTIVGGAVSYYTGSTAAGAAAGAATGAATNKDNRLMGAVTGGMAGYGGGQLGSAIAGQGGISSLANSEGWSKLLGEAGTPANKATGVEAKPATGLGGWGGALQAGGLGIGVPLLMGSDSGSSANKPTTSSIMNDPNAPASWRLVRHDLGGVKQPGASESAARRWFDYTYEPTGQGATLGMVPHGADGGAVSDLPTSQKAYDYLHNRGKLDHPGGGAGIGTPPAAGGAPTDESGGAPPQTVKEKPPVATPQTFAVDPAMAAKIKADGQAGRYYDADKLIAALSTTAPGKDGRTVLGEDAWKSALKPITGLSMQAAPTKWDARSDMPSGGDIPAGEDLGYYKDAYGQRFNRIKGDEGDPNIYLKYSDNNANGFLNPTGSKHDKVQPTYKLDPKTGEAVPVNANTNYQPGQWVDYGRRLSEILGTVVGAGVGGAALMGAGPLAGIGAAPAMSGMDLAADAAVGGNSIAGAGGMLSTEAAGNAALQAAADEALASSGNYYAGTQAGNGIMGGLTNAYEAASPYLKTAQTGLSALNALKGQPKGGAPAGDAANDYVPPSDATGPYGGRNLFGKHAEGGVVALQTGGFVFPADVVAAVGAGSSSAGLETLAKKFGATPVSGTGHGQSDDVQATIDGTQPARVARDEATLDAEQVAAIGGGDPKKGAKKLYAMMDRIRKQSMGHTNQMRPVKMKELA